MSRGMYPVIRTIAARTPAAGANFSIVAPGDAGWRILSLVFTLTTDATVANREVRLMADDGTTVDFATFGDDVQAASLSWLYSAVPGAPFGSGLTGAVLIPWSTDGLYLPPGHRLLSAITNLAAGDQLSAIGLMVEEFPISADTEFRPTVPTSELDRS